MIKTVEKCRLCDSENIPIIWDFGYCPLANAFKDREDLDKKEREFPLRYFKCSHCHSVQLKDEINSDILFREYLYESPPNLIPHFKEMASTTSQFLGLKKNDLVLDIGSNNGLLLKEFGKLGYKICGVEPAKNIVEKARDRDVPTFNEFFNVDFAKYLNTEFFFPKLITSTNCFAHISNLNEFVEGLKIIMGKDSYFVFENAYLKNTIHNLDFGQAYFEHIFMHSITPLQKFFDKWGLELFKVEYNKVQMGSIRGYVRLKENQKIIKDDSIWKAVYTERLIGIQNAFIYEEFIKDIERIKDSLLQELDVLKIHNKTISVYGWPAKMTLLNKYFRLEKYIDYVIEEGLTKIGKYCPGTKLEIKSLDYFKRNPTDNCIIGAYNFESDIRNKNPWYQGVWINPLNV